MDEESVGEVEGPPPIGLPSRDLAIMLAEALREAKPELPVLFMSGYSQGVLGPGHLLAEGVQVLQKPFHERALLAGVHDALRGGWAPPAEVAPSDTSAD